MTATIQDPHIASSTSSFQDLGVASRLAVLWAAIVLPPKSCRAGYLGIMAHSEPCGPASCIKGRQFTSTPYGAEYSRAYDITLVPQRYVISVFVASSSISREFGVIYGHVPRLGLRACSGMPFLSKDCTRLTWRWFLSGPA